MNSHAPQHEAPRMLLSKLLFVVLVAAFAGGLWFWRSYIEVAYRPVAVGLAATLAASLLVWPLSLWATSGWSQATRPPSGLEGIKDAHKGPGPIMLGVLEAVVFYAAFVSTAWVVAGGWLVFKGTSKWAAWQHIMKVPEKYGEDEAAYFFFRRGWSSQLLTSFLFGTLANVTVAFAGATAARVLANMPLQATAFGGG